MALPPLLFHVGYHKTATTWLQNVVFKSENGFSPVLEHPEIFDTIVSPHGLMFDPSQARSKMQARRGNAGAGSVDVVSLESLTGNPFFGGRESDDYAYRLKKIAPDAKILLTIREQIRIIASVYMQYLLRGGTKPADRFFKGDAVGGYFRFDPEHFEYHRLVGLYQDLFGADNVLVLPLETIAADQREAIRILAEFTGNMQIGEWTPHDARGVSYPERAAPMLRRINHFRQGPMNPFPVANLGAVSDFAYRVAGGGLRRLGQTKTRPVTNIARARFAGKFAHSNARLKEMLAHKVDLSAYDGAGDKTAP